MVHLNLLSSLPLPPSLFSLLSPSFHLSLLSSHSLPFSLGFPLSSLPQSCQEPLLVAVGSCPPLAQESVFRYCIDRLLGEVRTGLPSYGTRVMLQLFIQSNPSTCTEATERVCTCSYRSSNRLFMRGRGF